MARGRRRESSDAGRLDDDGLRRFALAQGLVHGTGGIRLGPSDLDLLETPFSGYRLELGHEAFWAMIVAVGETLLPEGSRLERLEGDQMFKLAIHLGGRRWEAQAAFPGPLDRRGITSAELTGLLREYAQAIVSALSPFASVAGGPGGRQVSLGQALRSPRSS